MKDQKCKCKEKEEVLNKEMEDLKNTVKRVQAEFENYKKRTDNEGLVRIQQSNAMLITSVLPIIDTFELALRHESKDQQFKDGITIVYDQLIKTLSEEGLTTIDTSGMFDPYLHEAVLQEASTKPSKTILEELQKGYMLNGKVLRHARVKIAKNNEQNPPEKNP